MSSLSPLKELAAAVSSRPAACARMATVCHERADSDVVEGRVEWRHEAARAGRARGLRTGRADR